MFDVLVRGGSIVDGSGSDAYTGDVGIVGDAIADIGRDLPSDADSVIVATGRTITPGFIDLHGHSDLSFLVDPHADSKLRQGVTFELAGNCGSSYGGPLFGRARTALEDYLARSGWSLDSSWSTFDGYLRALTEAGSTINIGVQVGHGTIRQAVMGMESREPSAKELAHMADLVAEALDAGALGLSTGLWYAPGAYSQMSEIVTLAFEAATRNRIYSSHVRSESDEGPGVMDAHSEAIDIGRQTGVRVQISHVKMVGESFRGRGPELLERHECARDEGIDVAADIYPYTWSGTSLSAALFPRWALAGGRGATLDRLGSSSHHIRLRDDVKEALARYQGPEGVVIATYVPDPSFEGRSLAQIAVDLGCDPFDAILRIFKGGDSSVLVHAIDEEDMKTLAQSKHVAVASDGNSLRSSGPLSIGKPHPRSYGAFPRFLEVMVRPDGPLPLEEAIRKMTSLPAQRLGLTRRGRIAVGYAADLVIMNPAGTRDESSYQAPHRYPSGVDEVLVNGQVALRDGQPTGVLAGRVIRSAMD